MPPFAARRCLAPRLEIGVGQRAFGHEACGLVGLDLPERSVGPMQTLAVYNRGLNVLPNPPPHLMSKILNMRKLFQTGYDLAAKGCDWEKVPPGM